MNGVKSILNAGTTEERTIEFQLFCVGYRYMRLCVALASYENKMNRNNETAWFHHYYPHKMYVSHFALDFLFLFSLLCSFIRRCRWTASNFGHIVAIISELVHVMQPRFVDMNADDHRSCIVLKMHGMNTKIMLKYRWCHVTLIGFHFVHYHKRKSGSELYEIFIHIHLRFDRWMGNRDWVKADKRIEKEFNGVCADESTGLKSPQAVHGVNGNRLLNEIIFSIENPL